MVTIANIKPHPLAELFPKLSEADFEEIKNSISAGFDKRCPIYVFEGKILDGRHRYQACKELGVTPEISVFNGTIEAAKTFVANMNLKRRNLTIQEKREIAQKLADYKVGRPAKNVKPGQNSENSANGTIKKTKDQAAKDAGIGLRTVKRADYAEKYGIEELQPFLKDGTISYNTGDYIAHLSPLEQEDLVKGKSAEEINKAVSKHRKAKKEHEQRKAEQAKEEEIKAKLEQSNHTPEKPKSNKVPPIEVLRRTKPIDHYWIQRIRWTLNEILNAESTDEIEGLYKSLKNDVDSLGSALPSIDEINNPKHIKQGSL